MAAQAVNGDAITDSDIPIMAGDSCVAINAFTKNTMQSDAPLYL